MKYNIDESFLITERQRLGTELKEIRESQGMDRKAFAEKMGISVSTVSKIEAGKWNFGIDVLVIYGIHLEFKIQMKSLKTIDV